MIKDKEWTDIMLDNTFLSKNAQYVWTNTCLTDITAATTTIIVRW